MYINEIEVYLMIYYLAINEYLNTIARDLLDHQLLSHIYSILQGNPPNYKLVSNSVWDCYF